MSSHGSAWKVRVRVRTQLCISRNTARLACAAAYQLGCGTRRCFGSAVHNLPVTDALLHLAACRCDSVVHDSSNLRTALSHRMGWAFRALKQGEKRAGSEQVSRGYPVR